MPAERLSTRQIRDILRLSFAAKPPHREVARVLLDDLNNRPMRGWGMSRRPLLERLDRPALGSSPLTPYEHAEGKRRRVGPNTAALADVVPRSRPHPEQGFRSRVGILGLVGRFGAARLDAARSGALVLGTRSSNSRAAIPGLRGRL